MDQSAIPVAKVIQAQVILDQQEHPDQLVILVILDQQELMDRKVIKV